MMRTIAGAGKTAFAVAAFFGAKVALGLIVLAASARWLPVGGFAIFAQFSVLLAYFATLATAGVQNGLIQQIAVAGDDVRAIARQVRAALTLWIAVAFLLAIAGWLFRGAIAILLAGTLDISWAVPWLAVFAIIAGLGQLLCAILTGQGRTIAALAAQAAGLVAGTLLALAFLHQGNAPAAALAFASGQGTTTILSAWQLRATIRIALSDTQPVRSEIMRLLGFSGAFLATASIMPLTLLGLRSVYRASFGLDALGYWLAANRISDVNTQLLGLYMTQAFLPAMARAPASTQGRLIWRTAGGAAAVMSLPLVAFLLAPIFITQTFLSAKFLPAIGFVTGYFVGDIFRVGGSIASYAALAQGRLILYVGIEAASAILLASFVASLTFAGVFYAPPAAYILTYATISVVSGVLWLIIFPVKLRRA